METVALEERIPLWLPIRVTWEVLTAPNMQAAHLSPSLGTGRRRKNFGEALQVILTYGQVESHQARPLNRLVFSTTELLRAFKIQCTL